MNNSIIKCKNLKIIKNNSTNTVETKNNQNSIEWNNLRKRLFPNVRNRHVPTILKFTTVEEVTLLTECDEKNETETFFINGTELLNQMKILQSHAFLLHHPITLLKLNKSDLEKIASLNDSVLKSYLGYTFKAGPLITSYFLPSFTDVALKLKEINSFIEE